MRYGFFGLFCLLLSITAGYAQESTLAEQPAPASVEDMKGPLHESFQRSLSREPIFPGMREELERLPQKYRDPLILHDEVRAPEDLESISGQRIRVAGFQIRAPRCFGDHRPSAGRRGTWGTAHG